MSGAIDPRTERVIAWLGRRFGAGLITPLVADQERRSRTMYDRQREAAGTTLPADERSHARLLHAITGGTSGMAIARFEGGIAPSAGTRRGPPSWARMMGWSRNFASSWVSPGQARAVRRWWPAPLASSPGRCPWHSANG